LVQAAITKGLEVCAKPFLYIFVFPSLEFLCIRKISGFHVITSHCAQKLFPTPFTNIVLTNHQAVHAKKVNSFEFHNQEA
jgi:hypothetical protein